MQKNAIACKNRQKGRKTMAVWKLCMLWEAISVYPGCLFFKIFLGGHGPRPPYSFSLIFLITTWQVCFWGWYTSTSVCRELTCNGLVSHPGGVKESYPLNTTETGDKHRSRSMDNLFCKGFSIIALFCNHLL